MTEALRVTRRRLLAVGSAAAATSLLPEAAFASNRNSAPSKTSWFERGTYKNRVGDPFRMSDDAGSKVALTLVAVRDLAGKTARGRTLAGRNDSFLLDFAPATRGPELTQRTRTFEHASLGRHDLFVVPSREGDGALRYSVLVNRSE